MSNLELRLHKAQSKIFTDGANIRMLCAGRRFGKTRLQVVSIIANVMSFDRELNELSPETVLVVLPTLVQAKRVIWKPLVSIFSKIPGSVINRTEHTLSLPGKPMVIVAGAESADGIRGLRVWKFHGDEVQDFPPSFLETVVFPAMSDTEGSSSLLTFTPKGKTNWTYQFSQRENTKLYQMDTLANPFINPDEVEKYRKILPPRVFRQEYQASFESFAGQFFTEFSPDKHNIFPENMPTFERTFLGVDFGDIHPAYVVVGLVNRCLYVVEWEHIGDTTNPVPSGVFLSRIADASKRWNCHRTFCDPSRPSAIVEMRTYGRRYSVPGMERSVSANNPILPGISDINSLLFQDRLMVIEKANSELLSYRRKPIRNDSENFEDKVADGQNDHCVDAMRYVIHSLNTRNKGRLVNGNSTHKLDG